MSDVLLPVMTDEDSGEQVTVTQEMCMQAVQVHAQVQFHWHSGFRHMVGFGLALKDMSQKRLYLSLGFTSFEAYTRSHFEQGRHWAYDRIRVAEKLKEAGVDVDTCQHPPSISQLRAALPLPSADFALLVAGDLPAPSGDRKPLADMPVKDVEDLARARKRAEEAERRATELEQRALAAQQEANDTGRRLEKAVQEKSALEDELRKRPTVEVPVVKPDDRTREENAHLREENAQLRAGQGRLGTLQAEQEKLLAGNRSLKEENEALKADNAHLLFLQEEAHRVNMALRDLQDVVTRHKGLFQTAKAKEYGDWIDLQGIYDTETLLQGILVDFHRITKDCVRR